MCVGLWVRMTWATGVTSVMSLVDYCRLPLAAVLSRRAEFISAEQAAKERRRAYIAARAGRLVS